MHPITPAIARAGGVMTTRELRVAGFDDDLIRWCVAYGTIIRARKGLYVTAETHPLVVAAVQAGGRLACRSALLLHGASDVPAAGELHIEVPRSQGKWIPRGSGLVVHWTRHPSPGTRTAVAAGVAREQWVVCRRRAEDAKAPGALPGSE